MDKVVTDVVKELQTAIETHSLFTSAHQAYAIILEELDELWDEIKKKKSIRDERNMRAEAVQVAAMAIKFIVSMENEWKPVQITKKTPRQLTKEEEEQELRDDAKCVQCRYAVITDEELAKMEADPCETCRDLCNWKSKEGPV